MENHAEKATEEAAAEERSTGPDQRDPFEPIPSRSPSPWGGLRGGGGGSSKDLDSGEGASEDKSGC